MVIERRTIAVGWEHEVPLEDVQSARSTRAAELERFFQVAADTLTDREVAQYLVRVTHPSTHYLRADVTGLGYTIRTA